MVYEINWFKLIFGESFHDSEVECVVFFLITRDTDLNLFQECPPAIPQHRRLHLFAAKHHSTVIVTTGSVRMSVSMILHLNTESVESYHILQGEHAAKSRQRKKNRILYQKKDLEMKQIALYCLL